MGRIEMNDNKSIIFNSNDNNYNILIDKPEIESIVINNQEISSNDIDIINQQKHIKIINFNFCTIIGSNIKFSTQLNHLIFAYTSIDFSIINYLDNLKELEIVNDEEDKIEIDIKDLLKFENLKTLRIYNSRIKNAKKINKFQNLNELFLDGSLVDTKYFSEVLNKTIKLSYKNKYLFD